MVNDNRQPTTDNRQPTTDNNHGTLRYDLSSARARVETDPRTPTAQPPLLELRQATQNQTLYIRDRSSDNGERAPPKGLPRKLVRAPLGALSNVVRERPPRGGPGTSDPTSLTCARTRRNNPRQINNQQDTGSETMNDRKTSETNDNETTNPRGGE